MPLNVAFAPGPPSPSCPFLPSVPARVTRLPLPSMARSRSPPDISTMYAVPSTAKSTPKG